MFDGLIYRILDKIVVTCEKIREWKIKRSLPRPCRSAQEWAKDHKKWQESRINNNDTE